jgi:hypothetical protein
MEGSDLEGFTPDRYADKYHRQIMGVLRTRCPEDPYGYRDLLHFDHLYAWERFKSALYYEGFLKSIVGKHGGDTDLCNVCAFHLRDVVRLDLTEEDADSAWFRKDLDGKWRRGSVMDVVSFVRVSCTCCTFFTSRIYTDYRTCCRR